MKKIALTSELIKDLKIKKETGWSNYEINFPLETEILDLVEIIPLLKLAKIGHWYNEYSNSGLSKSCTGCKWCRLSSGWRALIDNE